MLETKTQPANIETVKLTDDNLIVALADGRTVSVPLTWYPRLLHGKPGERDNWQLIGKGEGIHWPDLDEDISIDNILLGKRSRETQQSLRQWLERRGSST
ncbi:MAG: DUF2442 domain-containing protein [Dehalococcoidia bacterium]